MMPLCESQTSHNPEVITLVPSFLFKNMSEIRHVYLRIFFLFFRLKEEYHALEEQNAVLNHSLEAQMLQGDSESASLELNECRMQRDQIFRNVSCNLFIFYFIFHVDSCVQRSDVVRSREL
jgi:hypothetical protein